MKITSNQFLDYLDSPWFYNIKYNTPIPIDERTIRSSLLKIAYVFLGSIYSKEIIGRPEMSILLDKELENAPHRIKPKDVISGLARLDKL